MTTSKPGPRRTIVLVDDHPLVSEGLSHWINTQPDLEVIGTCKSVDEATRELGRRQIDCLVLDLTLRDGSGFDVLQFLQKSGSKTRTLILSMHGNAASIARAMQLGARGYLLKHEASDLVLTAIRAVIADRVYLSPEAQQAYWGDGFEAPGAAGGAESAPETALELLSSRERQLFEYIARGLKTSEIAEKLEISSKTVESHKENIKRKLGVKSSSALVALGSKLFLAPSN